jgi:hypothetical protein
VRQFASVTARAHQEMDAVERDLRPKREGGWT